MKQKRNEITWTLPGDETNLWYVKHAHCACLGDRVSDWKRASARLYHKHTKDKNMKGACCCRERWTWSSCGHFGRTKKRDVGGGGRRGWGGKTSTASDAKITCVTFASISPFCWSPLHLSPGLIFIIYIYFFLLLFFFIRDKLNRTKGLFTWMGGGETRC